jgi:hypothetical protein
MVKNLPFAINNILTQRAFQLTEIMNSHFIPFLENEDLFSLHNAIYERFRVHNLEKKLDIKMYKDLSSDQVERIMERRCMPENQEFVKEKVDVTIHLVGYLTAASITPGIVCVKDIVNGKSVDDNCYSYYASSFKADNLVELVTKALISNLIFTTANHDLRFNFIHSIIFSKAAADTIFSVIMIITSLDGSDSVVISNFNSQEYSKEMLQYIAKTGLSAIVSSYLMDSASIANTALVYLTPDLVDLGASVVYQGAVILNEILNPHHDCIDFEYYI